MAKGCGLFQTRLNAGTLRHGGQQSLTAAVTGAQKRPISDAGGWGWDRRDSKAAIHPVVAATLALLGATERPTTRAAADHPASRVRVNGLRTAAARC
jgi:hypothetical protein